MDFQGFQHILPPALVVVFIVILLGISWASYRKFESIPPLGRWSLISLRGSSLILILLLLLNPYFYSSKENEVKPKISVFLDNSESTGITKGNYEGLTSYNDLLSRLAFSSIEEADINYFSIGDEVQVFDPDSLSANEIQTDLSAPINSILEMEDEVKAAVIITDGIITYGRNPTISAYNSAIPIFTIAIGDTANVRDISVSNIITNATGYTNSNHIIEAEISQSGFNNNSVTVSLLSNDEVIDEKQITFEADDQVVTTEFELLLEEAGLKQFEIRVQPLPNEWTDSNNGQLFSVDVIDDRVKILHIAFEVHPDIKAIRTIIERSETNELYTLTWLGGNRFIEDIPTEEEFNLIIVHGAPNSLQNLGFLSELSDTPTLFFELSSDNSPMSNSIDLLTLINSDARQAAQVTLYPFTNQEEHPILELPEIDLGDLPPLYAPLRTAINDPGAVALFGSRYNQLDSEYPVISVLERGNLRRGHVVPWGWYRMLQSTNEDHRTFTAELITNLVSWTASDPDDRMLRINPIKQVFNTTESPILNGSLRNERGDPENSGIIEIELQGESGSTRTFNMDHSGSGNYRLNIPRLSEGLYEYSATARKGGRELDSQNGEFLVSNTSSELSNTTRNDGLLRSIAENSGGAFFTYDDVENFWNTLESENMLEPQIQTEENYSFPVRSLPWFMVVLILLGSEWMLRKYYSLP